MADKRAMDRKWVAEPYDMDTALGINNSGILSYGYSLQDTDQVDAEISGGDDQGSKDVFNAQNSVLWMNIRDAYRDQIVSMYQSLRSEGKFNYSYIEQYFENHQSKWPEALVNEDSYVKYITPLIKPVTEEKDEVTGKTIFVTTSKYLKMLLGLKTQQRRRWLYNRFRFMDSKYLLGDAAANTIGMRLFHDGTLTVTPALDLYVSVRFGLGSTPQQVQATAGTPIDFAFENPSGTKDMETVIYSADLITDLGDLSVFYPNEIDLSYATRLRRLKIGSGEEGYSNGRLNTLDIRNKPVLEYLDLRNCPNLALGFDLEGSPRLEEAYFDGTAITGVDLAEGCSIEHLHLPDTITALTLMDLDKLTDLQLAGLSKVERCMIRNVSQSVADPISIVEQLQPGTLVYLEGINLELADAAAIDEFMDFLDTMKGVTRTRGANGRWAYTETEKAQVSGKIHTDSLTGAEIAAFKKRYPYISVTADHVTATISFKSYDGSVTYESKTIVDGADATYTGSTTPARASTPQYNYTFANSWSLVPNGTSSANALKAVWEDRDVYACFNAVIRSYSVKYMNEGTQVGATQTVLYGGNATPPADPTHPTDSERYLFTGWVPDGKNITGNTTCIAQYKDTSLITRQYAEGSLTNIDDSDQLISAVKYGAFNICPNIKTVRMPVAKRIGDYSFQNLKELVSIDFPISEYIGIAAFKSDTALSTVNVPSALSIENSAFQSCNKITEMLLPNATSIHDKAFNSCSLLHNIYLPKCTTIGADAFNLCKALSSIDLPLTDTIGERAFHTCSSLVNVNIPKVKYLYAQAFYNCTGLTSIQLPSLLTLYQAFDSCSNLTQIIISNNKVATLYNTTGLQYVSKAYVYVPDNLVEDYKSATNWSRYADRIKPISEISEG